MKKGITLVEVLCSIALISVLIITLYNFMKNRKNISIKTITDENYTFIKLTNLVNLCNEETYNLYHVENNNQIYSFNSSLHSLTCKVGEYLILDSETYPFTITDIINYKNNYFIYFMVDDEKYSILLKEVTSE